MAATSATTLNTLQVLKDYTRETEQDIFDAFPLNQLGVTQKLALFTAHDANTPMMDRIDQSISTVSSSSVLPELNKADQQSSLEEARYCLVMRSKDTLCKVTKSHQRFIEFSRQGDSSSRFQQQVRHMGRIRTMLDLMVEGIQPPLIYSTLDCAPKVNSGKERVSHIRTHDGLIWSKKDRDIEKHLTAYAEPAATFRDFKYTVMLDERGGTSSYGSALRAITLALSGDKPQDWQLFANWLPNVRARNAETLARKDSRRLPEALACIGFQAMEFHRRRHPNLEVGIILPGGSEIFWPSKSEPEGQNRKVVFIKACENSIKDGAAYNFDAVRTLPQVQDGTAEGQIVPFLSLPAEIRNAIYDLVLTGEEEVEEATRDTVRPKRMVDRKRALEVERRPKWQPALSLTCRQVNKELCRFSSSGRSSSFACELESRIIARA
ncbi:hypothetical protein LTR36_005862 [Oleoguttula mirabilis]|uniref:Uncharacterized protein n=1 Tax=Oleoguttula mirabilis TaxID=1507867 RepID=A0AAV9JD92_9PEZI|nr:hypothetical protein LTR36_005862 [Oleoguttula mirabilis]